MAQLVPAGMTREPRSKILWGATLRFWDRLLGIAWRHFWQYPTARIAAGAALPVMAGTFMWFCMMVEHSKEIPIGTAAALTYGVGAIMGVAVGVHVRLREIDAPGTAWQGIALWAYFALMAIIGAAMYGIFKLASYLLPYVLYGLFRLFH